MLLLPASKRTSKAQPLSVASPEGGMNLSSFKMERLHRIIDFSPAVPDYESGHAASTWRGSTQRRCRTSALHHLYEARGT